MQYRHRLTVQPRKKVTGKAGQAEFVNDGTPTDVPGNLRPLSVEEIDFYGERNRELRKYFCKTWPGDINAAITGRGAVWDQVSAETFDYGSRTQHVEVVLRKR